MNFLRRVNNLIIKNEKKIFWLIVILFFVIIFSFLVIKYQSFGYNALDLGIYNQVFYNSAQGDLFGLSIHPHSYLGDHFEIFILLLLPFYLIYKSPLTLLFLQTLFITLSAWPIYLIAKEKLKSSWPIIVLLIFLFNPLILNLLFFEFHLLPFAIPLLFFAFYFYYKNKFTPYLIFILLSLLVREDVSLVVIMFGLLALIEKKNIKWVLTPIIAGVIWLAGSLQLTGYFNQYGNYKFLSMYSWLGNSWAEIITNLLAHPWLILKQTFSLNNFLSFLAIFIPFFGLPLLKPKYLIPTFLVVGQLLLLSPNTSILIETHYPSLLIPFIFISLIFVLAKISQNYRKNSIYSIIHQHKFAILLLMGTTIIYSFITLSPIWAVITHSNNNQEKNNYLAAKITKTDPAETIISSFNFLPQLSSRQHIYSLHYSYLGKKQFSDEDFVIDVPIDKIYIDFNDFIIYYIQTKYNTRKEELYPSGDDNINQIINDNNLIIREIYDSYAIYETGDENLFNLVEFEKNPTHNNYSQQIDYQLQLTSVEKNPNQVAGTFGLSFFWKTNNKIEDDYFINVKVKNSNNKITYQKIYPLGYGLYPTSTWPINQNIKTNYWFSIPNNISWDNHTLEFQIIKIIDGRLQLNGERTAEINISAYEKIGGSFEIDYNIL